MIIDDLFQSLPQVSRNFCMPNEENYQCEKFDLTDSNLNQV